MENAVDRYPVEDLKDWAGAPHYYEDDGTMPENVQALRDAVIGRKIVHADRAEPPKDLRGWGWRNTGLRLTLDNGTQVWLIDTDDCCAHTTLESFLLNPAAVNHRILGIGTTEGYTKWHIYADFGDVLKLDVGWSCGNPFYYGYGFDIHVIPVTIDAEVVPGTPRELE